MFSFSIFSFIWLKLSYSLMNFLLEPRFSSIGWMSTILTEIMRNKKNKELLWETISLLSWRSYFIVHLSGPSKQYFSSLDLHLRFLFRLSLGLCSMLSSIANFVFTILIPKKDFRKTLYIQIKIVFEGCVFNKEKYF